MQAVQAQGEITNLEALFGDFEEQLAVTREPVSISPDEGPAMITATTITVGRVSIIAKC
ncbi:hypothetical protein [Streptomyces platensis]|uniref:hypothetical protein n=1 Tax=Streptomyces platensis TaxID=58346 RepID=UPI00368B648B